MRLLYLTPTAAMGGAERVLLDLLGMIRTHRPEWPVALVTGSDGLLADDARRLGVTVTVLPFPSDFARLGDAGLGSPATWARFARHAALGSMGMVRYVARLRRHIAAFRPDIIHTNGIKMHVLGALTRSTRSALVWHFHDYPSTRPVTSRLIRTLKGRCSAVITVSDSVSRDIRNELGPGTSVHTIWNAVDLARFSPAGPAIDLAALSGLPPVAEGVPTVGLVATFARWKGHLLFLDVLKALAPSHRFRAYIVGGPLYQTASSQVSMQELYAAVKSRGLESLVGLTGFIRDSAAALRSLDVVVHASIQPEPFGLVIAEAMASGRPVVVSDAGGVAEFVTPEQDALTYPHASAAGMERQLARLLDDAALRTRLGTAAERTAHERFRPERVLAQMLRVYESVRPRSAAA